MTRLHRAVKKLGVGLDLLRGLHVGECLLLFMLHSSDNNVMGVMNCRPLSTVVGCIVIVFGKCI